MKCDKIKIKLGIDQEKSGFIHLDELSNYYFARTFVAREIKYVEFISVNKPALYIVGDFTSTWSTLSSAFFKIGGLFFTIGTLFINLGFLLVHTDIL